jgi:hypothetical protein
LKSFVICNISLRYKYFNLEVEDYPLEVQETLLELEKFYESMDENDYEDECNIVSLYDLEGRCDSICVTSYEQEKNVLTFVLVKFGKNETLIKEFLSRLSREVRYFSSHPSVVFDDSVSNDDRSLIVQTLKI